MTSDAGDLVTCDRAGSGRGRLLGDPALAPLTRQLLPVRRVELEFRGHVRMREGQAHAVQAPHPDPQRWMMTSNDRVGSIVAVAATGRAQVALPRGLGVVTTVCGDLRAVTGGTPDAVWPAEGTDGLKACGLVDACLHGYHRVSIAHGRRRHKSPLPQASDPHEGEGC